MGRRVGDMWSKAQDEGLRGLWTSELSVAAIADVMRRTTAAVECRASFLKLGARPAPRKVVEWVLPALKRPRPVSGMDPVEEMDDGASDADREACELHLRDLERERGRLRFAAEDDEDRVPHSLRTFSRHTGSLVGSPAAECAEKTMSDSTGAFRRSLRLGG